MFCWQELRLVTAFAILLHRKSFERRISILRYIRAISSWNIRSDFLPGYDEISGIYHHELGIWWNSQIQISLNNEKSLIIRVLK